MDLGKLKTAFKEAVGPSRFMHASCSLPFACIAFALFLPWWALAIGAAFSYSEEKITAFLEKTDFDPYDALANFYPWLLLFLLTLIIT